MLKHYEKCPGRYCNVYLEEGVNARPKSREILNKSILLDKHEAKENNADDPLSLLERNYITLDILMQKMPNLRPSNFYNTRKVCQNCQLAYSIIDNQRLKSQKFLYSKKQSIEIDESFNSMQTRLTHTTEKFLSNIKKYKKRIQEKQRKKLDVIRAITTPYIRSKFSGDALELLSDAKNNLDINEDVPPLRKLGKTTNFFEKNDVCELAKSITEKSLIQKRMNRILRPSKTMPNIFFVRKK
ncbi:hypothetical protein SteCoe_21324 [Stentor coeruleus]|uniref:Uncharacterized protein n=1 Tax=Stentor coeruleus TaxID=5963 RepID=A0A1R2BQ00_9CILI|nr:hypothetical protein SteCoe_21324 [Stentor coeruleus]